MSSDEAKSSAKRRTICPNCGAVHIVVGEWPPRMICLSCETTFFPSPYEKPKRSKPAAPPPPPTPAVSPADDLESSSVATLAPPAEPTATASAGSARQPAAEFDPAWLEGAKPSEVSLESPDDPADASSSSDAGLDGAMHSSASPAPATPDVDEDSPDAVADEASDESPTNGQRRVAAIADPAALSSATNASSVRKVKAVRAPRDLDPRAAVGIGFSAGVLTVALALFLLSSPSSSDVALRPLTTSDAAATSEVTPGTTSGASPAGADTATGATAGPSTDATGSLSPGAMDAEGSGSFPVAAISPPLTEREQYFALAELAAHAAACGDGAPVDVPLLRAFQRTLGLSRSSSETIRAAASELARTQAYYFAASGLPIDASRLSADDAPALVRAALESPREVRDGSGRVVDRRDRRDAFTGRGLGAYIDDARDPNIQAARLDAEAARSGVWATLLPLAQSLSLAAKRPREPAAITARVGDRDQIVGEFDHLAALVKQTRDSLGVVHALRLELVGAAPLKNVTLVVEATDMQGVVKRTYHFIREWPAGAGVAPDPAPGWEAEPARHIVRVAWQAYAENAPPIIGQTSYPAHVGPYYHELLAGGDDEAALASLDAFAPLAKGDPALEAAVKQARVAIESVKGSRSRLFEAFAVGREWSGRWSFGAFSGPLAMKVLPPTPDPFREASALAVTLRFYDPANPAEYCDAEGLLQGFDAVARSHCVESVKLYSGLPHDHKLELPRTRDYLTFVDDKINPTRRRRFVVRDDGQVVGECQDGTVFEFVDAGDATDVHALLVRPPASVATKLPPIEPIPPHLLPGRVPVNAAALRQAPGEVWRQRALAGGRAARDTSALESSFVGFEEGGLKIHAGCTSAENPFPTMYVYEVAGRFRDKGKPTKPPEETNIEGVNALAWNDLQDLLVRGTTAGHDVRVKEALSRVQIRGFSKPKLAAELRQYKRLMRLVWSPLFEYAAWETPNLRVFNFKTDAMLETVPARLGPVSALAFSSDGATLFGVPADGAVHQWELPSFADTVFHPTPVDADDRRPRRVVSIWTHPGTRNVMLLVYQGDDPQQRRSGDYELHLWEPGETESAYAVRLPWKNPVIVPSHDWRRLVVSQHERLSVWDATTGREIYRCVGLTQPVKHFAVSADDRLVAALEERSEQPWLVLWSIPSAADDEVP